MSVVFTKSARASAMEKVAMVFVALVVGACFAGLVILKKDLPLAVLIASGLAVLCSIWMTIKLIRETIAVLKSGEEWRVEINQHSLSWYSPVPDIMQSFQVPLTSIQSVQRVYTKYKGSGRNATNHFYIHFTNGQAYELKEQLCGISPMKVFKAIEDYSIPFIQETKSAGSRVTYIKRSKA